MAMNNIQYNLHSNLMYIYGRDTVEYNCNTDEIWKRKKKTIFIQCVYDIANIMWGKIIFLNNVLYIKNIPYIHLVTY